MPGRYRYAGGRLRVGGQRAISADCCCGDPTPIECEYCTSGAIASWTVLLQNSSLKKNGGGNDVYDLPDTTAVCDTTLTGVPASFGGVDPVACVWIGAVAGTTCQTFGSEPMGVTPPHDIVPVVAIHVHSASFWLTWGWVVRWSTGSFGPRLGGPSIALASFPPGDETACEGYTDSQTGWGFDSGNFSATYCGISGTYREIIGDGPWEIEPTP